MAVARDAVREIKQHYDAEDLPYFYSIDPETPKALVVKLWLNITLKQGFRVFLGII